MNRSASARAETALGLRLARVSWTDIASRLGYASPHQAAAAVRKVMAEHPQMEDVDTIRRHQSEALDRIETAVYNRAKTGDLRAVRSWLELETFRSRLWGTFKPPPQEIPAAEANLDSLSDAERIRELNNLLGVLLERAGIRVAEDEPQGAVPALPAPAPTDPLSPEILDGSAWVRP